jgi:hypothetical protein
MPEFEMIKAVVAAIDMLIPATILTVWLVLKRSEVVGVSSLQLAIPLCIALGWGALWTWVPGMAALRLMPAPAGQAGAILALTLGLCLLLLHGSARHFFRTVRAVRLLALGPWRIVYGAALLVIGLGQGLPPAFFWSAAIGDIAVGIWSLAILARRETVSEREVLAWNAIGLADLMHVLALGAVNLRPFYLANPDVAPLNLLPLVGVPVFIALHVLTLWGLTARRHVLKTLLKR